MAALVQHLVLRQHAHDAADRGADEDAGARRVDRRRRPRRPGLARRGDGEQDVALEPARVLRPDDGLRVEPFTSDAMRHGKAGGVEGLDEVDAAPSRDGGLPRRARVEAERRDRSEPGDDDAAHRRRRA